MTEEINPQSQPMISQDLSNWIKSRHITINLVDRQITGSINAAILLGHLQWLSQYFKERFNKSEFYKTNDELMEYTNLSEKELRNAKEKLLTLELISITKKGSPAKNHYTLNTNMYYKLAALEYAKTVVSPNGQYMNCPMGSTHIQEKHTKETKEPLNDGTPSELSRSHANKSDLQKQFEEELWSHEETPAIGRNGSKAKAFESWCKITKKGTVLCHEIADGWRRYVKHQNFRGQQVMRLEYFLIAKHKYWEGAWEIESQNNIMTETQKPKNKMPVKKPAGNFKKETDPNKRRAYFVQWAYKDRIAEVEAEVRNGRNQFLFELNALYEKPENFTDICLMRLFNHWGMPDKERKRCKATLEKYSREQTEASESVGNIRPYYPDGKPKSEPKPIGELF